MISGLSNSKEVIRSRMLKHALNYWNIKNTEDLDPIVKLIMEALSAELYNLGNDLKDTEVRLLEKIANLLAPEFLTAANTAHAILHALPVEPVEIMTNTTHFYTPRKVSSKQDEILDTSIDIFFTPVDNLQLHRIDISCMATRNSLYLYDTTLNRQLIARSLKTNAAHKNELWLGLTIDEKIVDMNNQSFYFDWKNMEPQLSAKIYQLLPFCKWTINHEEVNTQLGLHYETSANLKEDYSNLFTDRNLMALMEKDIKEYYHPKFVTISGNSLLQIAGKKEVYPAAFTDLFAENDLQKMQEKLVWLKIEFPAAINQETLEEVFIYTNAFPVINRQLNDLTYRLKGGSNIIPLKNPGLEQFLAVHSFSDQSRPYKSIPYKKMEEEETGTYTLRTGGVERFDGRNAKEFISYLLELLRSESAAFSSYGHDFIATTLREMNQRISLMEQKTKGLANTSSEIPHYIIVKPFEGQDQMYAEYWTTLAELANTLRSGTRLIQYNGTKASANSLIMLTTSTGGKNRLKPEERLNAFRYGLITRNRIITKEDIRNFCYYELGSRVSDVKVEKGFAMSTLPQQGFNRTIDIIITPSATERIDAEGWQALLDQLKSKLKSRSGMSNHYRVLLNK